MSLIKDLFRESPTQITVLPPLASPEVAGSLRDSLEFLGTKSDVAVVDSPDARLNAVDLELRQPRVLDEIFTELIRKHLELAVRELEVFFTGELDQVRAFAERILKVCDARAA